ncbi:MAG: methylenetetrahydrofolate reductase [Gammaproteobacteria bacterium]|nr:methylenetetrahydrofolate reductase [Gammaproteobacteria bacterium]
MNRRVSEAEKQALARSVHDAYMEIFPTDTVETRLDVLEPGSYVAITCSPSKGVEETLAMSGRIAARGFRVVPHIAARMVRDKAHLREIMARLDDMPIVSLFVPGGDSATPAGKYIKALDLLRDIAEFDHRFDDIGVAGHPEGHPIVSSEVMIKELSKKQAYSNYVVTQMCFDAAIIGRWIRAIREAGISLPVWLGLPSASDRSTLLKTSLRIGVGNSLRYLKNHGKIAARLLRSKIYQPDDLLFELAPYIADPDLDIRGHHIYCFNQVEKAEQWRRQFLAGLQ